MFEGESPRNVLCQPHCAESRIEHFHPTQQIRFYYARHVTRSVFNTEEDTPRPGLVDLRSVLENKGGNGSIKILNVFDTAGFHKTLWRENVYFFHIVRLNGQKDAPFKDLFIAVSWQYLQQFLKIQNLYLSLQDAQL